MKKTVFFTLILFFQTINLVKINAQNIDYQTLKNIEKIRSPSDTKINHFLSDIDAPICIGAPILIYGVGLIQKKGKLKAEGLEFGVAFAATVAGTYALKYMVNRPRPYVTHTDLVPLSNESSRSFPSGHTSSAFSLATSLSLNYPKWYVAVPAFAWATATGYSRLYLGVHYPTDVLTGAALGAGTAWLTHVLNKKWLKSKKKTVSLI